MTGRTRAWGVALLALAGCGAGGGGGSGTVTTVSAPTPSPSASGTPTPSPSGAATPSAYSAASPIGGFVPVAARVATTGATLRVGRCINLSDMLEAPNEGDWSRPFRDGDAANIAGQGFTGVRLPVRFSAHAGTAPPYTIDPAFLARVRHVVDVAVAAKLSVILDLHHYDALYENPVAETPRFVALWRQIAVAFRDAPAGVSFELLNEPNGNLDDTRLPAVMTPALAAVRESNPTRIVVIDGPAWDNMDYIDSWALPADRYIVPTFHSYDPQNFAFGRVSYMNPPDRDSWGTDQDLADLRAARDKIAAYMAKTGRVPLFGEYGVTRGRSTDQRRQYIATVGAAYASIGVQNCAWGYLGTYGLYDDVTGWDPVAAAVRTTTD